MDLVESSKKDLVDRINTAVKELGLDSAIADLGERLVFDKQPQLEDAYLFAQTADNERSEFEAALQIQKKRLANTFWVINGIEAEGFPGYAKWRATLGEKVGYENMTPLSFSEAVRERFWKPAYFDTTGRWIEAHCNVNTLSESQSLMALAKAEQKPFWYVVSVQFHFIRAYMTLASEIIQSGRGISAYYYPGVILPWDEFAAHSQGTQVKLRKELLLEDLAKIPKYSNIRPTKEIMDYMDRRALPPQPPQPLNSGSFARQS